MSNVVILHRSFQNRVLISSFDESTDKNPVTHRVGIRSHWLLTSLVLRLLSVFRLTSGIVSVKLNGSTVHLNKGSFDKWCTRHGLTPTTQSAEDKIQNVLKKAFPSRLERETHHDLSTTASVVEQTASSTTAALRARSLHGASVRQGGESSPTPVPPMNVRRRLFIEGQEEDVTAAGVSAQQPQAAVLNGASDATATTLPAGSLASLAGEPKLELLREEEEEELQRQKELEAMMYADTVLRYQQEEYQRQSAQLH